MTTMRPDRNSQQAIQLLFEQGGVHNHPAARMAQTLARATGKTKMLDSFSRLAMLRAAPNPDVHPFLSPDPENLPDAGVLLGKLVYASNQPGPDVYMPAEAMWRHPHCILTGAGGSGKSWTVKHITYQSMLAGEVCWFFDTEGDFIDLVAALPQGAVWVIRHDQLRRNPLEPLPGENPLIALGRLKTVLREATFMRDGAQNLMSELVHKLYAERGILSGGKDYPCLEDIYREAKQARWRLDSRRGQYGETLMSRLSNIIDNMGVTYRCKQGFPIEDLTSHSIVFDITSLSRDLSHLFVADLVLWVADYKLRSG